MQRKLLVVAICMSTLTIAGVLLAQQEYPNYPDLPVLLDNDHVVVQKNAFEPGTWAGEHSHSGKQLVVILDDIELVYKEDGKERSESFKSGDVFWIDAVTHDHKAVTKGTGILITLK